MTATELPKMPPNAAQQLRHLLAQSEGLNQRDQADSAREKLVTRRQKAAEALTQTGWPRRKDENWHYTALTPLYQTPFDLAQAPEDDQDPAQSLSDHAALKARWALPFDCISLVFVDGVFSEGLSQGLGAISDDLSIEMADADAIQTLTPQALKAYRGVQDGTRNAARAVTASEQPSVDDVFLHLNEAVLDQGITLRVAAHHRPVPVQMVYLQTQPQTLTNLRVQLVLAEHAQLTVMHHFVSLNDTQAQWVNRVQQVSLASGACCRQVDWQDLNEVSVYSALQYIDQAAHSQWQQHALNLGGAWSRQQSYARMLGEGADAEQNSLAWARGQQLMDVRTETQHAQAHCTSRQNHKFVVQDQARGVFNGMIGVAQAAQKTDGQMDNKNLILSPTAKMDTKPQLEIYADDVACSHGCASGEIDASQVFYLQARGIARQHALQMITQAFLLEPLESVQLAPLRQWLHQTVTQRLSAMPMPSTQGAH